MTKDLIYSRKFFTTGFGKGNLVDLFDIIKIHLLGLHYADLPGIDNIL
jgi:hypothetical protein